MNSLLKLPLHLPCEMNQMKKIIDDSKTPSDYLDAFYAQYNLGEEGGKDASYVKIEFSKFVRVYIPNWDDRRKAVLRHDIHHLLTGYESVLHGEFEIAGWEIGSGCMNYWAAYLLNSGGLLAGMIVYPRPTFRAFILGCRTSNLYQHNLSDEELKHSSIRDLKNLIGLRSSVNSMDPNLSEVAMLIVHYCFSFLLNCLVLLFSPLLILYNIWMYGKKVFVH